MRARLARVRATGDDGQLLLLVLAYTVIAGLLVTVVVDVSQVFLYRRSLLAAADAAALTAANAPDLVRIYTEGIDSKPGNVLPLSRRAAADAVDLYAADAALDERFAAFEVRRVETDGASVTVTFTAAAPLPFVGLVTGRFTGGYPVAATATARSPLLD
jgi:Flp pilus assembly protein TadG